MAAIIASISSSLNTTGNFLPDFGGSKKSAGLSAKLSSITKNL